MPDAPRDPTPADALLRIRVEQGDTAMLDAAGIWARATARRDDLQLAPRAEDKLAGISTALSHAGSSLLLARYEGVPAAFAILVPRVDLLEVLYLAVDPSAWSTGIAGRLLDHIRTGAQRTQTPLELWVIADNNRAMSSYERAGWTQTTDVKVRNSSGRPERRFTLSHQAFD